MSVLGETDWLCKVCPSSLLFSFSLSLSSLSFQQYSPNNGVVRSNGGGGRRKTESTGAYGDRDDVALSNPEDRQQESRDGESDESREASGHFCGFCLGRRV